MKHIPALDGIRTLAIAMVIFFHGHVPFFAGAFVGVDIFFVLSGFLITGLLLQEIKETGRIRLVRFYIRRALRLYPALVVMLTLVLLYDLYYAKAGYYREVIASGLYVMNYAMAFGYVRMFTLLSHTWTLAVEEQFYLIWPLLLLLLRRAYPDERIVGVLGLAVGFSVAWYLLSMYATPVALSVNLRSDTRMSGLLLGSVLSAIRFYRWRTPFINNVLLVSSCVLLWCIVVPPYGMSNHKISVIPILTADIFAFCLIAKVTEEKTSPVGVSLGAALPAFIGRISYGLYLFHVPVGVWARQATNDWKLALIMTLIGSTALALLSYFTVELWARRVKYRPAPTA